MSVDFKRPDFLEACQMWHLIRDIIAGEQRVKDHDFHALHINYDSNKTSIEFFDQYDSLNKLRKRDTYLRVINPDDRDIDNLRRNAQYIKCAVLMNVTKRTQQGMSGLMFAKRPKVELSPTIEYLNDDADGSGIKLEQQMKSVAKNTIATGRHGLLAEFPATDSPSNVRDVQNGNRAYIQPYKAENIINWRTKSVGAKKMLTLVVLREFIEVEVDEFELEVREIYRVLKLDENGLYTVEVHLMDEGQTIEHYEPKNGLGARMDYIPFCFVGAEDNDESIDHPPLYDIAALNMGHYRNSADVEENSFFASQMTITAAGLTQQWIDDVWQGKATIGSRAVLTGNEGASFGSIQASESNLARSLMEDKQKQMTLLGAKLIEPSGQNKTATQSAIDAADANSVLSCIAANVEDAYKKVIGYVQDFMNDSGEVMIEFSTEFVDPELDPQEITALLQAYVQGAMSLDSFLWNMKRGGRLSPERTLEQESDMIVDGNAGL